jgi:hypothetical protein
VTDLKGVDRRSFVGGLLALAMPAIIRTPGLLMPIKVSRATDTVSLVGNQRYLMAWSDWRGMWGALPGDMDGFQMAPDELTATDRNVDLAQARMRHLRDLERRVAQSFQLADRR